MYKTLFSISAIALTFILFFPYIRSIHQGRIKPHVFSWVIWGIGTFIVFLAQLAGNAGLGAWPIGVSSIITSYIAFLSYLKRTDRQITKLDWLFLVAALSALLFWFFTSDPKWAVIILTLVDLIGFGPTVRKAYYHPYDESVTFFSMSVVRNLLVVFALEQYSLTTILFPSAVGIACLLLVFLLAYRQQLIRTKKIN